MRLVGLERAKRSPRFQALLTLVGSVVAVPDLHVECKERDVRDQAGDEQAHAFMLLQRDLAPVGEGQKGLRGFYPVSASRASQVGVSSDWLAEWCHVGSREGRQPRRRDDVCAANSGHYACPIG